MRTGEMDAAFLLCTEVYGFDALDLERFDDGAMLHGVAVFGEAGYEAGTGMLSVKDIHAIAQGPAFTSWHRDGSAAGIASPKGDGPDARYGGQCDHRRPCA